MNLATLFCPNIDCPARGQSGEGNIHPHNAKHQRYRCAVCRQTFTTSKGTLFYRLKKEPMVVIQVITLLAYGCPLPAIVHAFDLDERTVKSWWRKAGEQCQRFHEEKVTQQTIDLEHVQMDEIKVKVQGGHLWLGMALMVATRLWLGGVVGGHRDADFLRQLVHVIRQMALCRPLLLAVDGLPGYVKAFRHAFRTNVPGAGRRGRYRKVSWPDIAIVRLIKPNAANSWHIRREIVQGEAAMIERLRVATQGCAGVMNTAYIERLNATFRQRLAPLARRSRHLACQPQTIVDGLYLIGVIYNFCQPHRSLRLKLWLPAQRYRWVARTPAMAAGLADHIWTVGELLKYPVPPPRWSPPRRKGDRTRAMKALIQRWT